MKRILRSTAAAGVAVVAFCAAGLAGAAALDGSLRGTVIDARGKPLAGVTLALRSARLGIAATLPASDAAGRFQSPPLPAGNDYVLKASLQGYAAISIDSVQILPGRATVLNVTLMPESSVRENVSVRAQGPTVDLDERGVTTRVSSEFIDSLPILGRNYQDVLTLAPGVSDVDGDGNPNIHGARDTDVGTLVDGVNTTDPLTGKIGAQLNIESIQEIEVKTAGATAEFGRAQGGFANIITRSGGNDFEGFFKFYWRGSALDGDGAGTDPPSLHGGIGEHGLRDLTFNDYLPFLSLSGPIVRDRAWFFATFEAIHKEEPINAVSQAFVTGLREKRVFAKATWQASVNNRLALSLNYDPQEFLNQGLNSLTAEETGFTLKSGGPLITLRDTAVLSPSVALDSMVSWFESRPALDPNLGPDNNHDGILYIDRNSDGFLAASERDPGEDYDQDGAFDSFEDVLVADGMLTETESVYCPGEGGILVPAPKGGCAFPVSLLLDEDGHRPANVFPYHPSGDGDRRLTPPGGCEGANREDLDCDGHLDNVNEDRNHNGILDAGEDRDGDFHLDLGTEDRNHNGILDDTPFPAGDYPYGHRHPILPDRDYTVDLRHGLISGPYYQDYDDRRSRFTLRQDLSLFVADGHGPHDVKTGYVVEREQFDRAAVGHQVVALSDPGWVTGKRIDEVRHPELHFDCNPYEEACHDPGLGRITALLPVTPTADEQSEGLTAGLYVQDTWRPVPNVSLALGLRFDRETATSQGYTFFDPRAERRHADSLIALAGTEGRTGDDLLTGNDDGVINAGIAADPLFGPMTGDTVTALQARSLASFTLHRSARLFGSQTLESLYPDLFRNGTLDVEAAAALGIQTQQPETFRITNNNLSPRLGVSWDPAGDGRSKLFTSWGRYYDRLFLSSVTGEQGVESIDRYYVFDRDGVSDPVFDPTTGFDFEHLAPDHYMGTLLSSSPPTVTQVDRGLRTPYSDEWIVGLEREVAPETSLALRYIRRDYRDQLQDVDVNHVTRTDPRTGLPSDFFGALVPVEDPVTHVTTEVRVPDGKPDLYVQNVFFNQVLRVGNTNTAVYHGIELELRRRLARRWQMQGSYTYSRAQGQAEDFQSRLGNDPSTVESEYGYLDFDQRHVVKVNGSFFLPHDWQMGTSATWASGLPYSIVSRFLALDNVDYQQFRTRYGTTVPSGNGVAFRTMNRNSERNGSTFDLNASVRKNFVLGRTTWAASLEVFNILNRDELRIHTYEPNRPTGFDASSASLVSSPLQLDAERRFGRRFQLGFQVQF